MALTEREKEILRLWGKSFPNSKIARVLHVHQTSVSKSRKNAFRKLEQSRVNLDYVRVLGFNDVKSEAEKKCGGIGDVFRLTSIIM